VHEDRDGVTSAGEGAWGRGAVWGGVGAAAERAKVWMRLFGGTRGSVHEGGHRTAVCVCAEGIGGPDEAHVNRARVESAGAAAERGSGARAAVVGSLLQRLVPEAELGARRASLTGREVSACVGGPRVVCSAVGSAEAAWWDCADLVWVLGKWVEGLECRWGEVAVLGSE
jgi:hypothetical protein